MPEPLASPTGVTVSISLGVTGTILGAQADGLILALAGAVLVAFWLTIIDSFWKALAAVLFCTLLGGFLSPLVADVITQSYPRFANGQSLRLPLALLIGASSPMLFPIVLNGARRYTAKKAGQAEEVAP